MNPNAQREAHRSAHGDNDLDDLDAVDRELAMAMRTALRASEHLDYVTSARLSAARARALESGRAPHRRRLLASGGLAAAAVMATVMLTTFRPAALPGFDEVTRAADTQQAEAMDVLTDDNEPEFYEDLDLYRWLDSGPSAEGPAKNA